MPPCGGAPHFRPEKKLEALAAAWLTVSKTFTKSFSAERQHTQCGGFFCRMAQRFAGPAAITGQERLCQHVVHRHYARENGREAFKWITGRERDEVRVPLHGE